MQEFIIWEEYSSQGASQSAWNPCSTVQTRDKPHKAPGRQVSIFYPCRAVGGYLYLPQAARCCREGTAAQNIRARSDGVPALQYPPSWQGLWRWMHKQALQPRVGFSQIPPWCSPSPQLFLAQGFPDVILSPECADDPQWECLPWGKTSPWKHGKFTIHCNPLVRNSVETLSSAWIESLDVAESYLLIILKLFTYNPFIGEEISTCCGIPLKHGPIQKSSLKAY